MRIAQLTPVYPPYRGGTARIAYEYTERLRARGHEVDVVTPGARLGNAGWLRGVASRTANADVIHLHYPFYGGAEPISFGFARSARAAPPIVLTYHMDAQAGGLKGVMFDVHRETLQPAIVRQADAVLVSSRDYAESSALARVEGALDRADVLPFGVDLDRFHPGREPELRSSLGIGEETPLVLFVGTLDAAHEFKGLDVLMAALARLQHLPWNLLVVGDGDRRARFEQLSAACGLRQRVTFAGDVGDDDLPRCYRSADLHVLPSTSCVEAFGLVTLEASASGLPSVVSNLPGVRGNVVEGVTGRIVPPRDVAALSAACHDLLASAVTRQRLGVQARLRAERECAWDPLIDRLEAIYERVVHGH